MGLHAFMHCQFDVQGMGHLKIRIQSPQAMALAFFFFFNDTAPTEISTLSLPDPLPIWLKLDAYFALRPPAGGGPLTVGWFGRMVPVKNIALLAATIEIALERSQDIRFVIAGDGPDRSALHGLLDRYGGRVEWLGWQREILPAMARCDVVLQTSRNEGTPVALIQGMAAARPFVSTAVGGVVDMVTGGAQRAT